MEKTNAATLQINIFVCLMIGAFGLIYGSYESIANVMAIGFGLKESMLGLLISLPPLGTLIACMLFGNLPDKIGKRKSTSIYVALATLGLVVVAFSNSVYITMIGLFILGCGTATAEVSGTALLADININKATKWINFSQITFCLGAVISPVISANHLAGGGTYNNVFGVLACIFFPFFLIFWFKRKGDIIKKEAAKKTEILPFGVLKNKKFTVFFIMVILYICYEAVVPPYSKQLFLSKGLGEVAGSASISVYWFSMIISRLIGAFLSGREILSMKISIPIMIGGVSLMLLGNTEFLLFTGVFLCGFGSGSIWSMIYSLAAKTHPSRTGAAFSVLTFGCSIANICGPIFIGTFVDNTIITILICGLLATVLLILTFLSSSITGITHKKH